MAVALLGITIPLLFCSLEEGQNEVLLSFIPLPPDRPSTPSAPIFTEGGSESSLQ